MPDRNQRGKKTLSNNLFELFILPGGETIPEIKESYPRTQQAVIKLESPVKPDSVSDILLTADCNILNQYHNNLDKENKTFKFEKRHVSATPVPSSVYG